MEKSELMNKVLQNSRFSHLKVKTVDNSLAYLVDKFDCFKYKLIESHDSECYDIYFKMVKVKGLT